MNTLTMKMLGSFAQFERDLIVNRTIEGKEWAKKHNKNYREGRPKRILCDRYFAALKVMKNNILKDTSLITNISVSTLNGIKKQAKEEGILG